MASTEVQSRSMAQNLRSFGREIAHAVKALVSDGDVVDSKAAAEFIGTCEKIEEAEYRRNKSRKNSSSGRSTLTRIEPESPYQNIGVAEKHDDLDIGER